MKLLNPGTLDLVFDDTDRGGIRILIKAGAEVIIRDEDVETSPTIAAAINDSRLTVTGTEEPLTGTAAEDTSGGALTGLDLKANIAGQEFTDTVICYKDNASSFRLKGPGGPSVSGADVQSYAGMFYNAVYTTIGVKDTRASFGANYDMDLVFQAPHGLLLSAVDNTMADGVLKGFSRTNVQFHSRCDAEVLAPKYIAFDRIDAGTTGAANTSDAAIKTNSGPLHLNSDNTNGVAIGEFTPASASDTGVKGQVAYDADYVYVCVAANTWKRSALTSW